MVEDTEPYPNSFSKQKYKTSNPVYSTPYKTSNPFNPPDSEKNLILYIFPKQRTDVGSILSRMPPVTALKT